MSIFEATAKYKLIYIFSINDDAHRGLLKIGEATISTILDLDALVPNSKPLNTAASARIKGYTATAGIVYKLEHTELALREVKYGSGVALAGFGDKDVHAVLTNSGKRQVKPNGTSGNEWFEVDLETAKNAIRAVKEGRAFLTSSEKTATAPHISFREEQEEAVVKTLACFKKQSEMLWYAKMRFGKTLTSLEVVRRAAFRRVLIMTHRPVVGSGWREDFDKIFRAGEDARNYTFAMKDPSPAGVEFDASVDTKNDRTLRRLDESGSYFIYFASIQDLRGSKRVGGTFPKNNAVFDMEWDLIIVDEAHEGTQTTLGDNVMKAIRKAGTKVLALSGTPFNILDQYDESAVYTWDYVMEQRRKREWDTLHPGDHNPYAELPQMHIYTYELGDKIPGYVEHELEGKAFNFREFFRTWGDEDTPSHGATAGEFRHPEDVRSFLDLITRPDAESLYPYSTKEYRDMFKHTLWMVPGVKEARALSAMLKSHPVFCHFGIANVAGEGDEYEERHFDDALDLVRKAIKENDYSITLSCGKLTTGVTVKEWTAVLMLAGSYSTAAAGYMQTIFRVQSAGEIDGKQKTDCYVFDFAPDRTLKVLAETANVSRKAGKAGKRQDEHRELMGEFLNYCPVIAIEGTAMKPYSVGRMMEQLKRVYAERAIKNGFDDASIYNDNLMRLDDLELESFRRLKGIVGASKAAPPLNDVEVNAQGFSEEEHEKAEKALKKPKRERTPEEEELLRQREEQRKNRNNAISILRGVSIRMPLLIYGASIALAEDISIERFVSMVDDTSWEEFMPNGVTKELFSEFLKYYDEDVFVAAGKEIRKLAASADSLTPTERVMAVVKIFDFFKNPDKETVLTPWRVVNMHMSDCLGGWCFYDEKFEKKLDTPRFVDRGQVTRDTFGKPDAQILEINSKSGLYPLYVAYSIYRTKLGERQESETPLTELYAIWEEVVRENVFVICKTPMAKSITARTLLGYTEGKINAHYFEDLVNQLRNKPEQFRAKVTRGKYWGKEVQEMKFDAIVGNPPYQVMNQGNGTGADPIYHLFMDAANNICSKVCFIHPARFLFNAGKTPKEWNFKMLNDEHFRVVDYWAESTDVFPNVDVKGGIAITLHDSEQVFEKIGLFTPHKELRSILTKVLNAEGFKSIADLVYPRDLYRLTDTLYHENPWAEGRQSKDHKYDVSSNIFDIFPELFSDKLPATDEVYAKILGRAKSKRLSKWIKASYVRTPDNYSFYKVFVAKANGSGALGEPLSIPLVGEPNEGHTVTFLSIGKFNTACEAEALLKYITTKFARILLGTLKVTQDNPREAWFNVPLQDFGAASDIDWSNSVDEIGAILYRKYCLSQEEISFIEKTAQKM